MKKALMIASAVAALTVASGAHATVLTFDDLQSVYGDGNPILPNMTYNSQTLTYSLSGYVLSLVTSNAPGSSFGAHIGDGTYETGTYNWHNGFDNQDGAYLTLTRQDGRAFNLLGFDYRADGDSINVSAAGYTTVALAANPSGTSATTGFNNVTSVRFDGLSYAGQRLDNINVTSAVPEPATWGLMILGFGAVGGVMRRRSKVSTAVRFA